MKKLIPFLLLFPLFLFGEETNAKIEFKEVSVAPEYLTEKADTDAIEVGVVEIVEVGDADILVIRRRTQYRANISRKAATPSGSGSGNGNNNQ